jgi:glycosyltransferase involved in cell wall biosynthesis
MRAFVQDATKLNANKLKIIPSGLDFSKVSYITKKESRASLRLSEKNVYFGMIGRIDRKKRIELAIKALKLLNHSTVQLLIIGEETPDTSDTYLNELKKLISTLNLGDQVHFLGFQKDPSPFYRAIDALIMASDFETFGMSTIESLAHNTPVIASNAGGSRELLTKFPFGSLFHAGDHLSLSEAMRQLPNFSERPLNQQGFTNMFDHHNVCKMIEADILSSES